MLPIYYRRLNFFEVQKIASSAESLPFLAFKYSPDDVVITVEQNKRYHESPTTSAPPPPPLKYY